MQPVRPKRSSRVVLGCTLAFGIAWTLFASAFVAVSVWSGAPWFFALFSSVFVLVGLGIVGACLWGLFIRPTLIGRHFGPPLVSLEPTTARLGDSVRLRYEQPVRANVATRHFAMQLILRETATYRRGTNTYTVVHDGIVESYEQPGRHLIAGESIAEDRTFQIPRDGMHSFDAPRNKLTWLVRVLIDTPNAPDVSEELVFVVAPMVASEAAE